MIRVKIMAKNYTSLKSLEKKLKIDKKKALKMANLMIAISNA